MGLFFIAEIGYDCPRPMTIDDNFDSFFRIASYLTDPICKTHECFRRIYVVDTLNPTDSKITNFARKVFLGLAVLVFAFLALFTTLPGVAIRGVAVHLKSTPYIYEKGTFVDKTLPESRTFTVLSWNICCVAGGYPITDGGVLPWGERIDKILEQIIEKDADVNCVYEVFDAKSGFYIAEKLKENGYNHCYYSIGTKSIGGSSGILVASKYEIKDPEFVQFPQDTLVGRTKWAAKGVFGFDLASEGNRFARVFATHLQHSEEPQHPTKEELSGRRRQMEIIVDKVNQVRDRCVVVTGDLNLDDEEYMKSNWHHQFVKGDEFERKTWGGDAFCANLVNRAKRISDPLNLDHTMILKGSARAIRTTLLETGFDGARFDRCASADHEGLYSEIAL
jgi:hypothetical protein